MLSRRSWMGLAMGGLLGPFPTWAQSPRHRAWVRQLVHPPIRPLGAPPVITAVALHPHQPLLVAGGDDHTLRIWDLEAGQLQETLTTHREWVMDVSFAPDGRRLASAARDGEVQVWDVAAGRLLRRIRGTGLAASCVRFSRRGDWLAVAGFGQPLVIVETRDGLVRRKLEVPGQDMRTLAISPDGRWLAVAGQAPTIRVWQLDGGTMQHRFDLPSTARRIRAMTFSSCSQQLVTAGEDGAVRLWSVEDGVHLADLPQQRHKVQAVHLLTPDRLAAAGSDNCITLWDLNRRAVADCLTGHTGSVTSLDHSDRWLVSGSFDATVCVWSLDQLGLGSQAQATRPVSRARP